MTTSYRLPTHLFLFTLITEFCCRCYFTIPTPSRRFKSGGSYCQR